jgi:hypothetical protein
MKRACFIAVVVVILAGTCLAQSARQVEVVAEVSLTNQVGPISGTLYTPEATGMFRVNLYLQCTQGDPLNGQGLSMDLRWYDDVGGGSFTFSISDSQKSGSAASYAFLIKDRGGVPITWDVRAAPLDAAVYEVYIALERIGPKVQ